MEKLKPCPFCGGKAVSKNIPIADTGDYDGFIGCENRDCKVQPGIWGADSDEDDVAWNTRADNNTATEGE